LKFGLAQLGKEHSDISPQGFQRDRFWRFDRKKHFAN
jgi:hypothetical protein